jgi:hypothetical protein
VTRALDYRPSPYVDVPAWRRAWPLAWQETTVLFRSKLGVALFFLCLIPVFVRLGMLLIAFGVLQFGPPGLQNRALQRAAGIEPRFDPRHAEFYVDHVLSVLPGMVFALLLSTLVVARSVARDRPTNALELYWTRGISPRAYVLAKLVGGTLLLGALTVAAPALLWLTAVFLDRDWSLLFETAAAMAAALGGVAVATAVWAAIATMLSAAAATPNGAMVLWTVLLVGSAALGAVMSQLLRDRELLSIVSLWHGGGAVARAIAGLPQRGVSVGGAAAMLGAVLVVAWLRARPRLRVGEAVG